MEMGLSKLLVGYSVVETNFHFLKFFLLIFYLYGYLVFLFFFYLLISSL